MAFVLQDLLTAYKKAKREVFHQNLHLSIREFIEYEKDMISNLKSLMENLNNKLDFNKDNFTYKSSYFTIVKNINYSDTSDDTLIISNSIKRWDILRSKVESIDFRIIPDLDVNVHIIGSLWIDFYGKYLECDLSDNCFGSRIGNIDSSVNHFKPYVHDYRTWQQKGLAVIKENFKDKNNVVAITSDFNLFYHHIDPNFLLSLDEIFAVDLKPTITSDGKYLNKLLRQIIKYWSENTYKEISDDFKKQFRTDSHVGIPIGLSASKVIANLLLAKFDEKIERDLNPAYYGRYVDDIFIVLKDNSKMNSRTDVWNYIAKQISGLTIDFDDIVCYEDVYSESCNLQLNTSKERIFILNKSGGEEIIKEIEEELKKNSSEWRFIPESENDFEKLSEEITYSVGDQKDSINSLRKANRISIKRLKFANYLNKLEEIIRTHPQYFWKEEVKKLIYFVKTFALSPDVLFDYTQYIPRILQLVIFTENFKSYSDISELLKLSVSSMRNLPTSPSYKNELDKVDEYFSVMIQNSIFSGLKFNSNHGS